MNMRSRILFFAFVFAAGSLALPHLAHAAAAIPFFGPIIEKSWTVPGVIPGTSVQCALGWGAVLTVVNNIIRFLLTIAIVFVMPIMIAYAGFLYVVNPVSPDGKNKAKGILLNTIVGIVIALAGWLIVDAVMAVLYSGSAGSTKWGTWSSLITSGGALTCLPQEGVGTGLNQGTNGVGIAVVPPSAASASESTIRQQFASAGVGINHSVPCSPYNINGVTNGCTNVGGMLSTTVAQVIALKKSCGNGCVVTITGGSEAGHAAGTSGYSHGAGYKVDLNLDPVITSYIKSFTPNGTRSGDEPGPMYTDQCKKNQYVLTSNHWDITVYGSCVPPK